MRITIISIFILTLFTLNIQARPLNLNNKGFSMGYLQKVALVGKTKAVVEGQLLLGRESHADIDPHHDHKVVIDNPWQFCAEKGKFAKIEGLVGHYVIIEFKTPRKSALIQCEATNELVHISPVSTYDPPAGSYHSKNLSRAGTQAEIINVGRIVAAVASGKHKKNWNIVLQDGNSGNQFTSMHIVDKGLFYFAVDTLKYAKKVKVHHIERSIRKIGQGNSTTFVCKIENLSDI